MSDNILFAVQVPEFGRDRSSTAQESSVKPLDNLVDNDKTIFWAEFDDYFNQNEQTIKKAMEAKLQSGGADGRGSNSSVVDDMNTFVDTVNVVLNVLDILGHAHPILKASISAFHGVISLDLKQRDNNRKVLAVKLEMQTMMCSMFQLRHVRHVHIAANERQKEHDRLHALIDCIANDIKLCGSVLNHYQGRSFTARLVHADNYEHRFAQHVATFSRRRSELQVALQVYAARGIDAANTAIAELDAKVTEMGENISLVVAILSKFDSPREKDCRKFIKENGGLKTCITKEELLSTLVGKLPDAPESTEGGASRKPLSREEELKNARETLSRELSEDLKKSLEQNQSRFEKLLELQTKQMTDYIKNIQSVNTERIISHTTMLHNATLQLANFQDPELQKIWNEMGLSTRSVKARNFVLMLRDYLAKERPASEAPLTRSPQQFTPEGSLPILSESPSPESKNEITPKEDEDSQSWTLKYINVANVRPIVEAIDEDVSGFISIQEMNKFALSRPPGTSLLDWIAYWAAGWHINITDYCHKIYKTLFKMHKIIPSLRSVNQKLAYIYLDSRYINVTEATLRSLQSRSPYEPRDARLINMTTDIATAQEQKLRANLESMSYLIRAPADIAPIVGAERVETWILPLLHLLLERHLEILKLGQTKVLHPDELLAHSDSLYFALDAFDDRRIELKKIFKPIHRDPLAQLENFAYGMFHGISNYKKEPTMIGTRFYADFPEDDEENTLDKSKNDLSESRCILAKGVGSALSFEDLGLFPDVDISPDARLTSHPARGNWVGTLLRSHTPFQTLCLHIDVVDNHITGERILSGYKHTNITGYFGDQDLDTGITKIEFQLHYNPDEWFGLIYEFNGEYNHLRDTIKGHWRAYYSFSDTEPPRLQVIYTGSFLLTRSPPHAFRFLDLLHQPSANEEDTVTKSKLARRRWAFATQAVKFKVQEQKGSWKFISARLAERNAWIEVHTKLTQGVTQGVNREDAIESLNHAKLVTKLHPINRHIYDMAANYLWERKWFAVQVYCDSCAHGIYFDRYICVTCVEEDFSNQLDLCADNPQCISQTVFPERDLVHSSSHTLLRTDRHIMSAELVELFTQSNLRSEKIKRIFREEERKTSGHATKQSITQTTVEQIKLDIKSPPLKMNCTTCEKELTLPCWVCAICAQDTLFCIECESSQTHTRVFQMSENGDIRNTHLSNHMLLRVHDSAEAKLVRLKSIDKKLQDIQKNMQGNISKVDTRVEHLSSVVEKFGGRLKGLESAVGVMDSRVASLDSGVASLDSRVASLDSRVSSLDSRVANLDFKVDSLEAKMDAMMGMLKDVLSPARGGSGPESD